MLYKSTRGVSKQSNFKNVTLRGLAQDGGLYIPESWSSVDLNFKKSKLSFIEIANAVIRNFTGNCLTDENLINLIDKSYSNFNTAEITPVKKLNKNSFILELFHGPTLAFKDVALQFLGNIFQHFLEEDLKCLNIVGATSGDTGSAAIEAIKNNDRANIFILHPYKRISDFQRRQMTTVKSKNVFNLAIKGNFDDCQNIVKKLFTDKDLNSRITLGSINSINWTRIMAQITYYIYAYYRLKQYNNNNEIAFSVPTGNFGDAYAGYLAKEKFKIPIKAIIVATNQNDILHRFFKSGKYSKNKVFQTIAPSMDIQIASNFERLLFDIHSQDSSKVKKNMDEFKKNNFIQLDEVSVKKCKLSFESYTISENQTIETMKDIYKQTGEIIDPHTAIGIAAGKKYLNKHTKVDIVNLATAHPIKFSNAVNLALGFDPPIPEKYIDIFAIDESYQVFENDYSYIKDYIIRNSIAKDL